MKIMSRYAIAKSRVSFNLGTKLKFSRCNNVCKFYRLWLRILFFKCIHVKIIQAFNSLFNQWLIMFPLNAVYVNINSIWLIFKMHTSQAIILTDFKNATP